MVSIMTGVAGKEHLPNSLLAIANYMVGIHQEIKNKGIIMSKRQLISSDEAVRAKCQHTTPCSDCPFSRNALNGWLGGYTIDKWLMIAHGDHEMPCHTLEGAHCVGAAIYRANVCKKPRFDDFRASADREAVFATPMEFMAHHSASPKEKV